MPHVVEGPKGPEWVSAKGAKFGLMNGMGSAGREYVPGVIHRSDRMASTGLYDDGKKGIRRLTEVDAAPEGPGPRRRAGRGAVRRAGLERPAERSRGRDRDAAHLQRLAARFLPRRARSAGRPRQHSQLQHGRVGRRDDAQRQARRARLRCRQPAGHDAVVGPVLGAAVAVRARDRHPRALPHDRRTLARLLEDAAVSSCAACRPRTSPASRCTWATC